MCEVNLEKFLSEEIEKQLDRDMINEDIGIFYEDEDEYEEDNE